MNLSQHDGYLYNGELPDWSDLILPLTPAVIAACRSIFHDFQRREDLAPVPALRIATAPRIDVSIPDGYSKKPSWVLSASTFWHYENSDSELIAQVFLLSTGVWFASSPVSQEFQTADEAKAAIEWWF